MRAMTAFLMTGILALGAFGGTAARAGTVAMIEEVNPPAAGLQEMTSLSEGRLIMLRPGERLVIGYTTSCIRETIVGGVVVIGARESVVSGGTVVRAKTECDGGKTVLTADQAGTSAVMVFRRVKLGAP